jgi:hypothetical protein
MGVGLIKLSGLFLACIVVVGGRTSDHADNEDSPRGIEETKGISAAVRHEECQPNCFPNSQNLPMAVEAVDVSLALSYVVWRDV